MDPIEREKRFAKALEESSYWSLTKVSLQPPITIVYALFLYLLFLNLVSLIFYLSLGKLGVLSLLLFFINVVLSYTAGRAQSKRKFAKFYNEFELADIPRVKRGRLLLFAIFRDEAKRQGIYNYQEITALKARVEAQLEERNKSSSVWENRLLLVLLATVLSWIASDIQSLNDFLGGHSIFVALLIFISLVLVVPLVYGFTNKIPEQRLQEYIDLLGLSLSDPKLEGRPN